MLTQARPSGGRPEEAAAALVAAHEVEAGVGVHVVLLVTGDQHVGAMRRQPQRSRALKAKRARGAHPQRGRQAGGERRRGAHVQALSMGGVGWALSKAEEGGRGR